jgi:hypothetical protein
MNIVVIELQGVVLMENVVIRKKKMEEEGEESLG